MASAQPNEVKADGQSRNRSETPSGPLFAPRSNYAGRNLRRPARLREKTSRTGSGWKAEAIATRGKMLRPGAGSSVASLSSISKTYPATSICFKQAVQKHRGRRRDLYGVSPTPSVSLEAGDVSHARIAQKDVAGPCNVA